MWEAWTNTDSTFLTKDLPMYMYFMQDYAYQTNLQSGVHWYPLLIPSIDSPLAFQLTLN